LASNQNVGLAVKLVLPRIVRLSLNPFKKHKNLKKSVAAVNCGQTFYVFISTIKLSNSNGAMQGSICAII
jgi:hypothetical protein